MPNAQEKKDRLTNISIDNSGVNKPKQMCGMNAVRKIIIYTLNLATHRIGIL